MREIGYVIREAKLALDILIERTEDQQVEIVELKVTIEELEGQLEADRRRWLTDQASR